MRCDELAIGPLILGQAIFFTSIRIRVIEQLGDVIIVLIQNRHTATQIGNQQIALAFMEVAGQSHDAIIILPLNEREMLAIEAEILEAMI